MFGGLRMFAKDFGELLSGERILWSGQPQQGLLLTSMDVFLIPFSLFWAGFAIFWEMTVLQSKAPPSFALFGIPFILIGIYVAAGRFFVDAWMRRNTHYALTNRRILIVRRSLSPSFTSLYLNQLPQSDLIERGSGRGTIRFGPPQMIYWGPRVSFGAWVPSLDPTPQFLGIEDARRVYDQIQRASMPRSDTIDVAPDYGTRAPTVST